jgi:hypothetical protein
MGGRSRSCAVTVSMPLSANEEGGCAEYAATWSRASSGLQPAASPSFRSGLAARNVARRLLKRVERRETCDFSCFRVECCLSRRAAKGRKERASAPQLASEDAGHGLKNCKQRECVCLERSSRAHDSGSGRMQWRTGQKWTRWRRHVYSWPADPSLYASCQFVSFSLLLHLHDLLSHWTGKRVLPCRCLESLNGSCRCAQVSYPLIVGPNLGRLLRWLLGYNPELYLLI